MMYQQLPSLEEYVLISQSERRVERRLRTTENQWLLDQAPCVNEILAFPSLGVELPLDEIYQDVQLERSS